MISPIRQMMAKQLPTPNMKNGPSKASRLIGSGALVWNLNSKLWYNKIMSTFCVIYQLFINLKNILLYCLIKINQILVI